MARRLYVPASGFLAAPVSPAFDAGWEQTAQAYRTLLEVVKDSSASFGTVIPSKAVANTTYDMLAVQGVSLPLSGSGTISGPLKGQFRVLESNAAADASAQLVVKVVSNDGSTVRGTLLSFDTSALSNEFNTTTQNRKFPKGWTGSGASLTPVNYVSGDRIVIEVGARARENAATARTFTFATGHPSGTADLPEDETNTTGVAWFEFADTLTFDESGATARTSTEFAEVLLLPSSSVIAARVSTEFVEVLISPDSPARVTQDLAEVIYTTDPPTYVTQDVLEVVYGADAPVYLTQDLIEVVWQPTTQVNTDLALSYTITNFVSRDLALDYSITATVNRDLNLDYPIYLPASADLSLDYVLRALASRDISLDYSIVNTINRDLGLDYSVYASAFRDLGLDYAVYAAVLKDLSLDYGIGGPVSADLLLDYTLRNLVNKDTSLDYAIRSLVSRDTTLDYVIYNNASKDLSLDYIVANLAQRDLSLSYQLRQLVNRDLSLDYEVVNDAAFANLVLSYGIYGLARRDLSLNYPVGTSFPTLWSYKVDGVELNDFTNFVTQIPELENFGEWDVVLVDIDGDYPKFVRLQPREQQYTFQITMVPCNWATYNSRLSLLKSIFTIGTIHELEVQARGMPSPKTMDIVVTNMLIDPKQRLVAVQAKAARPVLM